MTVQELVDLLERMPPQAPLVFADACEEDGSYEDVEVEFTNGGEVVTRTV